MKPTDRERENPGWRKDGRDSINRTDRCPRQYFPSGYGEGGKGRREGAMEERGVGSGREGIGGKVKLISRVWEE